MIATTRKKHERQLDDAMGRRAKGGPPTRPVRLHEDVADLADQLAPVFGQSLPDFLSNRLRPILEGLREEAARILLKKKDAKRK